MFGLFGEKHPQYGLKRDVSVCEKIKENRWNEQKREEHALRLKERRKNERNNGRHLISGRDASSSSSSSS